MVPLRHFYDPNCSRKSDMVRLLLQNSKSAESFEAAVEHGQLQELLTSRTLPEKVVGGIPTGRPMKRGELPEIFTAYKDHFNLVDRVDRYLSEIAPKVSMRSTNRVHHRRLLHLMCYQAFAMHMEARSNGSGNITQETHYVSFRRWTELLARFFLTFSPPAEPFEST